MGHTPNSMTLKRNYSGDMGQIDTNRLVQTGEAVEVTPINPLLAPNLYRIKDIKLFNLTDEEIDAGINKNPVIFETEKIRSDLSASLNKKYGNRKDWPEEDKKEFLALNQKYKQQRRIFRTRLMREKLTNLHNSVTAHMVPGEDGVMTMDEDSIDLPKRTAVNNDGNDDDARVIPN